MMTQRPAGYCKQKPQQILLLPTLCLSLIQHAAATPQPPAAAAASTAPVKMPPLISCKRTAFPARFLQVPASRPPTSSAWRVRLVPYSSSVGILLLPLEPPPTVEPTGSWLSPTMRITCNQRGKVRFHGFGHNSKSLLEPHLCADFLWVGAQGFQHARSHALALTQQPQQDVLGADVVVACRELSRQPPSMISGSSAVVF